MFSLAEMQLMAHIQRNIELGKENKLPSQIQGEKMLDWLLAWFFVHRSVDLNLKMACRRQLIERVGKPRADSMFAEARRMRDEA